MDKVLTEPLRPNIENAAIGPPCTG